MVWVGLGKCLTGHYRHSETEILKVATTVMFPEDLYDLISGISHARGHAIYLAGLGDHMRGDQDFEIADVRLKG